MTTKPSSGIRVGTPEKRRAAQIRAMKLSEAELSSTSAGWALDALLAHLKDEDPATADAIRYGLVPELECREHRKDGHSLCINYPELS